MLQDRKSMVTTTYAAAFLQIAWTLSAQAGTPTPLEIQSQLKAFETTIVSHDTGCCYETTWKDRKTGPATGWETVKCLRSGDCIRLDISAGTFDESGMSNEIQRLSKCFNGRETFAFDYKYDPIRGSPHGIDTQVFVYDRPEPPTEGLLLYRDPLSIMVRPVVAGIQESLAAGREVSVIDANDGLLRLKFMRLVKPSPDALIWEAVVDTNRAWVITELKGISPSGETRSKSEVVYTAQNDGRWWPTSGSFRLFTETGQQKVGWDFESRMTDGCITDLSELVDVPVREKSYVYYAPLSFGFRANRDLIGFNDIKTTAEELLSASSSVLPVANPDNPAVTDASGSGIQGVTLRTWLVFLNIVVLVVGTFFFIRKRSKAE